MISGDLTKPVAFLKWLPAALRTDQMPITLCFSVYLHSWEKRLGGGFSGGGEVLSAGCYSGDAGGGTERGEVAAGVNFDAEAVLHEECEGHLLLHAVAGN